MSEITAVAKKEVSTAIANITSIKDFMADKLSSADAELTIDDVKEMSRMLGGFDDMATQMRVWVIGRAYNHCADGNKKEMCDANGWNFNTAKKYGKFLRQYDMAQKEHSEIIDDGGITSDPYDSFPKVEYSVWCKLDNTTGIGGLKIVELMVERLKGHSFEALADTAIVEAVKADEVAKAKVLADNKEVQKANEAEERAEKKEVNEEEEALVEKQVDDRVNKGHQAPEPRKDAIKDTTVSDLFDKTVDDTDKGATAAVKQQPANSNAKAHVNVLSIKNQIASVLDREDADEINALEDVISEVYDSMTK